MSFVETQLEQARIGIELDDEGFAPVESSVVKASLWGRVWGGVGSVPGFLFRYASWVGMLAVLAAVPVVNLYVLGVLIEVQGRVAKSKRWLIELPGIRVASQLGTIAIWAWVWLVPIRILASYARDAHLISPGSIADQRLEKVLVVVQAMIAVHLLMALMAGGRTWNFLNPVVNVWRITRHVRQGTLWGRWDATLSAMQEDLQPGRYFVLGLKGLLGAAVWLVPPTVLFAAAQKPEGGGLLVMLIGGTLLSLVLTWLPGLQTLFAREHRMRDYFQLWEAREMLARRPALWTIGMLLFFALGLPLYLFKIITPPADAMWLVTLIYIATVLPTKFIVGWLVRVSAEGARTPWYWRLPWYVVQTSICLFFVFLIFFTQNIAEDGKLALFKQHLFVLPF
ncbi:hypothetical protein [Lacunimicrobium album]